MSATGLQKALQNGALSQVLEPDYTAASRETDGRCFGNKTAFTIAGNIGGAAMVKGRHRRHWEALQALLRATAVMAKFSTVVSAIMHNPKLADLMQSAAKGDGSAVNALVRGLISGVDSGFNSPQPESQPPRPINLGIKGSSKSASEALLLGVRAYESFAGLVVGQFKDFAEIVTRATI